MSTWIMGQCWPITGMSIVQKAVLISLADQANDDGVCWPSVGTISKRTCASERAVQEAIRWLIEAKVLGRKVRPGKPTYYTVTPAAYAPPQEAHPAGDATQGVRHLPLGGAPFANITYREPTVEPTDKDLVSADEKSVKASTVGSKQICDRYPTVTEQIAKDWLQVRKVKKAPLTKTAWEAICRALDELATKHGISPADTLATMATKSWQGLKVQWVLNELQSDGGNGNGNYPQQGQNGGGRDSQPRIGASGRISAACAAERTRLAAVTPPDDRGRVGHDGEDLRTPMGIGVRD